MLSSSTHFEEGKKSQSACSVSNGSFLLHKLKDVKKWLITQSLSVEKTVYRRSRLIFGLDVVFLILVIFFFILCYTQPTYHVQVTFGEWRKRWRKKCMLTFRGSSYATVCKPKPNVKNRTMPSKNINVIWRIWSWEIGKKNSANLAFVKRNYNKVYYL